LKQTTPPVSEMVESAEGFDKRRTEEKKKMVLCEAGTGWKGKR